LSDTGRALEQLDEAGDTDTAGSSQLGSSRRRAIDDAHELIELRRSPRAAHPRPAEKGKTGKVADQKRLDRSTPAPLLARVP